MAIKVKTRTKTKMKLGNPKAPAKAVVVEGAKKTGGTAAKKTGDKSIGSLGDFETVGSKKGAATGSKKDAATGSKENVTAGAKAKTEAKTAGDKPSVTGEDTAVGKIDWKSLATEDKATLRELISKDDFAGYQKKARSMGIPEDAIQGAFDRGKSFATKKAEAKPTSKASATDPGKGSVTAGAKKKSGGSFKDVSSGWDEATKKQYVDLVSRANKGDATAHGILFRGTKDGGTNKFGLGRDQMINALQYAKRTGYAIKGYAIKSHEGVTSAHPESKPPTSSVDIYAPMEGTGAGYKSLSKLAEERAGSPRGGHIGWDSFTPGGWVAKARKAAVPTSRMAVESTILKTNAGLAALAAADAIGRSVQNATGTELKDQNWGWVEYLNPLLGVATLVDRAARNLGSKQYPVAERTQFAVDQERRRKEFDDLIARASRTVDSNGNPTSVDDFRTAFNRVRARYVDAMTAAKRLGGEELRTAAMDRARSQANASLTALSANKPFMDANYAPGDLAAVNKALKAIGYADEIDDLNATEDFIINSDVDAATQKKYMDTYKQTMTTRSGMTPIERLGW